jgi:hypothetical protein
MTLGSLPQVDKGKELEEEVTAPPKERRESPASWN